MSRRQDESPSDLWSKWLLHDRHGGDLELERIVRSEVDGFVDRVLDAAELVPGMSMADIGTGDGALAYRAIDRVGASLKVLLCDISAPLLERAQAIATERGLLDQCTFLEASAESLHAIADCSVDVVTTRAVLAYVPDRRAALREFHRILKPGGRMSIAEPVLQDDAMETIALRRLLDSQHDQSDRLLALVHRWKSAQYPDTSEKLRVSPICNYSERDLFGLVSDCGFERLHMELHVDGRRYKGVPWATFVASSPHPWAPTLGTLLQERFSPEERLLFEEALRPSVEAGQFSSTSRNIYLRATKTG